MGIPCLLHTGVKHEVCCFPFIIGPCQCHPSCSTRSQIRLSKHHRPRRCPGLGLVCAYIADDYYQTNWHYTLSLEEVPNSGENIHALCNGISNWSEGWCPKNEQQAMEVYSELVVRNFMPNSHAAGVLDESEVSNIPDSLQTGYRTKNYKDDVAVPDPIDNVDAVANRGSNGVNDVYGCGPVNDDDAYLQNVVAPTIGFLDDSAAAPNHCTALGMHNGYGDDFDNFKLKNVPCDETRYIICSDFWLPYGGSSHGGFDVVGALMHT